MKSAKKLREDIEQSLKDLASEDEETRQRARASLLNYCTEENTINVLQQNFYRTLEGFLEGGERQVAAVCMSRVACFRLTKKAEWDMGTLIARCTEFADAKMDVKKKTLLAVRLYLIAYPDKVALVKGAGWLKTAISSFKEYPDVRSAAILLLDAVRTYAGLPPMLVKKPTTATALADGICAGQDPECQAAMCLALQMMQYVEGTSASAADTWLATFQKRRIVNTLLTRITTGCTDALFETAARSLADLSQNAVCLEEMRQFKGSGDKKVLGILVAKASAGQHYHDSILGIFRRILTFEDVAAAFIAPGGPGLAGAKVCLAALEGADLGEAIRILRVLKAWSKENLQLSQVLEWSPLVGFLSAENPCVVDRTCDVVSHILRLQEMDDCCPYHEVEARQCSAHPVLIPC
jgi:hypothetical protein